MAAKFTCPHCQHQMTVDESFVGESGDCAICGKPITIEPDVEEPVSPQVTAANNSAAVIVLLLTLGGMTVLVALVVGLVVVSMPSTQFVQSTARQEACAANLLRIGKAMLDYHDDNGHFPPAYLADADGTRKHSWRMLLLPYLGEHSLHEKYNMSLPWSENTWNCSPMPGVYHCPDDQFSDPAIDTSYLLITGPGMIFDGDKTCQLDDITDGPENTILAVEVVTSGRNWLEPKDLDRQSLNLTINSGSGNEIGSYHPAGGAHVLMADGKVRWLDNSTSPQLISSLLTIDAGDNIEE